MHSALEDREKAFGGIGVSVTAQPPVTGQHRAVTALHEVVGQGRIVRCLPRAPRRGR
jgi:hypothetical protein